MGRSPAGECVIVEGAAVRGPDGRQGRIGKSGPEISVIWEEGVRLRSGLLTQEEFSACEVLTLDRGWVKPLVESNAAPSVHDPISELRSLLEDHNPFQNKSRLGPGPRGSTLREKKKWQCSGSNYQYTCVGVGAENKGRVISINIDPEYKAVYNRAYKRFMRNRRRK